jgi:hypothetical protein
MEGVDKEIIDEIAEKTAGFSGREITKMVIAWHDAAFTLPDAVLTPDVMRAVVKKFQLQHKLKDNWTSEESKLMEKMITNFNEKSDPTADEEKMEKVSESI